MEKPSKLQNQICPSLFLSKPSLLCIAALLVLSLGLTCVPGSGFSPFIVTIPILILSTAFLIAFKKNEKQLVEKPVQDENPICDPMTNPLEDEIGEEILSSTEKVAPGKAAQQSDVCTIHEPGDFPSDSESSDDSISSENFELNGMYCINADPNGVIFSDSVAEDDEDGLIEIAIPGSDSSDGNDEPKQKVESYLPDFLSESVISQQGLTELLADINDVNEEENLIEIDISMGSIKCSRFEIEA